MGGDGGRFTVLAAAANADDGSGEVRGEAKLPGAVEDLGWTLAIDERFRDDEARTKRADSGMRGGSHSGLIPFIK